MKLSELLIGELIKNGAKTPADLSRTKRIFAKNHNTTFIPNVELIKAYHNLLKFKRIKKNTRIEELLKLGKVRSLSGIVNISVLTKPYTCPGKCIYCPEQEGIPKSYLDSEPAVMRAILNKFDPILQIKTRITALENNGHPTDKIGLRIVGGTWSFYPKQYQTWFIKKCFEFCNGRKSKNLKEAQKINETAKYRIVGITIETRPDFITEKEIKRLRKLGVTRVELGVQSIYDNVLKLNKREHKVEATIRATRLLKDAGFKICYQMMPNLPGSTASLDKKMFHSLFSGDDFHPDLLKIYPTAILKEAPLYRWWKEGRYRPFSKKTIIEILKGIEKTIPYYVRIQRVVRDISASKILAGPAKISNLRQVIVDIAKSEGWKCRCIRCREIRGDYSPKTKLYIFRQDYRASKGIEIFLSFEDKERKNLYSLLRLRIPSKVIFSELEKASIIREIHTYGQLVSVSEKGNSPQHKGLGKRLIKEAEKITKEEFKFNRIAVISGVGVRGYFRKAGYTLGDYYMSKDL